MREFEHMFGLFKVVEDIIGILMSHLVAGFILLT